MSGVAGGVSGAQPTESGDHVEPATDRAADRDEVVRLPIDPAEPMASWLAII